MSRIFGLLILVIDILAIIDIVKNVKQADKKVIWIVVVIFLPVLGPILYYFLGRK